ncbi:MAG TPA: antibiotic biosynthesis monooxygenase [Solirubrobacterales bacterium]|nr:antibiotic biosynthesis monooxygenase [Solirubrobacterales bacterium]
MSYVRVGTYEGDAEALERGFGDQIEAMRQLEGFERAYLGVDRESGKAVSLTFWESREALDSSAQRAQQAREDATAPSDASIVDVASFELVITLE